MKKKSNNDSRMNSADLEIPPMTRAEMRRGVLGKYATTTSSVHRVVGLDPDVAKYFPSAKAVNEGLRKLCEIQKLMQSVKRRKTA